MENIIYARPRNAVGPNKVGGSLCQATLFAENEPSELPTTGKDIVGMSEKDTFAAGSILICIDTKNVYLVGADEGPFILWKEVT